MNMLILLMAGGFEVAGVSTLNHFSKSTQRRQKIFYLLATIALFACSLSTLSLAMQSIPLSIAYAIWTGIGTIGAVLVGVLFNHEKLGKQKMLGVALVIVSVVMLKLV